VPVAANHDGRKRIGLVLGGGGARGLAHLGVIKALEERGFVPDAIAGTSMGAIIGALVATGMSPEDIMTAFNSVRRHELLDFGAMGGIIGGKGIENKLAEYVPGRFEDLRVPLKVTAVDVQTGRLVVLGSGPLVPALRASSSLPGILSPTAHLGRTFIDGGLLNNLPVDVIRTMTLKPVVAVDVAHPPNRYLDFEHHRGIFKRLKKLRRGDFRTLTVELFMKSFDIPAHALTELLVAMHPPELLVRPDLDVNLGLEDIGRAKEAYEEGYRAAAEALEDSDWYDTSHEK
jgi:NTE family protein